MTKYSYMHRVSVAALLAAAAASSTPLLAQTTDPSVTVSEPVTAADPAPVTETPVETTVTPIAEPTPSEVATKATTAPAKSTAKASKTATKAAPAKTVLAAEAPVVSSNATNAAAPTESVEPLPTPSAEALAGAAEAQAIPTATDASTTELNSDAVAFGGALALLMLGAGALGVSRRRKHVAAEDAVVDHHEMAVAPPIRRETEISPPRVAPPSAERSAFAWGQQAQRPAHLTPMEMAHRGPTPDNPSVSLKKRLKRAAFFEQRERDAAAGHAVPVSRWAGLPDRLVKSASNAVAPRHRELQPA